MVEVPKFAVTVPKDQIGKLSKEHTPIAAEELIVDPKAWYGDAGNKYAFQLSFFAADEIVQRIPQSKIVTKQTSWLRPSYLL